MTCTIRNAACFLTSIAVLGIAASPAARAQPRDEGLVAYWSFDEGEGDTAYDCSGNENDGTIYGAIWTAGPSGTALEFDGLDDYVDLGSPMQLDDLPYGDLTITAWIYDRHTGPTTWGTIFGTYIAPDGWTFRTNWGNPSDTRRLRLQVPCTSVYAEYQSASATITEDVWHFVAATWDSGAKTATLYIDAQEPEYDLQQPGSGTYKSDALNDKNIGRLSPPHAQYFKGIIDEVRIYDRALSEEEIQDLYSFHGGFSNTFSWATFDAGEHGVGFDPDGYSRPAFDGRYVYFAPTRREQVLSSWHGEVLRYDTAGEFGDVSSWATFDPGEHGVGEDPDGYAGAVFDGRYVYFVPYYNGTDYHGEVLRYDTLEAFASTTSWITYDPGAHGVGVDPDGYVAGVFDGRYVYFAPESNGTEKHGEVLRLDTTGDFDDSLSWATYDAGAQGIGSDPDGYTGAVFDGRFVYFTPFYNGSDYHGEVLRYDATGGFSDASSWDAYDTGADGVGADADGYHGAVFDGRFIYYVPSYNGSIWHSEVLRYDTHGEFGTSSSWTTYDPGTAGVGDHARGFRGGVFDGKYVFFSPARNDGDTSWHGEVLRYDTACAFNSAASWASFDASDHEVGDNPRGYVGAICDGRYIYFAPQYNGTEDHGEVLRYDTAAGVPGVDVAVSADDVGLTLIDPDVEAAITVHNLGIEEASDVVVEVFKRVGAAGFVSAGTDMIASIQPASQASTSITFTPDLLGQEIKVVVSLSGMAYDGNPSNNQVIVIWNGGGDDPVVLAVEAEHDGDDQPDVAGRYIADVALNNTFYASVLGGASHITGVSFQMDADPPVAGTKQADGRWRVTFDMGALEGGVAHTLTVVATDSLGIPSAPKELTIDVIPLPSWAEEWNSEFPGWQQPPFGHANYYCLGGFIPLEWRLDQTLPSDWLIIGGRMNRYRAGIYTTAEVSLDRQIFASDIMPGIYVCVIDFDMVDFKVNNEPVPSGVIKLLNDLGYPEAKLLNIYNALDIVPAFDTQTLEFSSLAVQMEETAFSKDIIDMPLTPAPIAFFVAGWPMSFEADMTVTPGVAYCMTVTWDDGVAFIQPTYIRPNLNLQVAATINVVEMIFVAVGASIQPNLNFAYDIAWIPPDWDADWLIRVFLDICLRLRCGWGAFSTDYDLGCVTLLDYTWDTGGKGDEPRLPETRSVDPLGVLNRPVLVGGLGRGERVLVYALDDPDGNPAEIAAQVDPGTAIWGPQVLLTDDLYADLDPTLAYTHDGRAVAVWTKVETLAEDTEGSTIDELIGTFDLYWSIWDGVDWSAEAALTDDAFADGMVKVAFSDVTTSGLTLWCRDEANDFDDVTDDEIAFAMWDGSTWSAPAYLTSDALGDRQVAVCYRTGTSEALAVWTKETDPVDHFLTVYSAEWDGVAWTAPAPVPGVTEEWVAQVNVSPLSDGRVLAAWAVQADDGWQVKVAIFDATTGWGNIEIVQSQLTLVDGLQLQVSADDVVHVFWHGFTLDDDLFGVSKDIGSRSDTWVGPTTLTSGEEIEWQVSGALDAGGELSLVFAREQNRRGDPLPKNRNGLPDELGGSTVPGGGNWTVTDDDLTLLGAPWLYETVTIEAVLTNTGTTDSVQTTAQFWLGDPNDLASTPIGDSLELPPIPSLDMLIIESEEFTFEQVGQIDVYLVVAAPVAELDPSDNQAILSIDVINNDTTPPQVLQTTMTPLRDSGRLGARLVVTFDEPMTPPTVQDVLLVGDTSGQSVPDQVSVDPTGEVMTVVVEDYLSQDMYTFTLIASRVTDEAGNQLDGDSNGTGGDDYVTMFSLLAGDWDQDGDVDLNDFAEFPGCISGPWAAEGFVMPSQNCLDVFDLDADVDVDLKDFASFQRVFVGWQ